MLAATLPSKRLPERRSSFDFKHATRFWHFLIVLAIGIVETIILLPISHWWALIFLLAPPSSSLTWRWAVRAACQLLAVPVPVGPLLDFNLNSPPVQVDSWSLMVSAQMAFQSIGHAQHSKIGTFWERLLLFLVRPVHLWLQDLQGLQQLDGGASTLSPTVMWPSSTTSSRILIFGWGWSHAVNTPLPKMIVITVTARGVV